MYDSERGMENMLSVGDYPFPICLPEPYKQGEFRLLPAVSLESYDPEA